MKKIYSAPEVELRKFDVEDIITTSTVSKVNTGSLEASTANEIAQSLNTNIENVFGNGVNAGTVKSVVADTNWNNW